MQLYIEHQFITLNEYIAKERIPYNGRIIANNIKQSETNEVIKQAQQYHYKAEEKKYDVIFEWKCKNLKKDPDNISFAQKFILDGLVKAGVFKNDTFKYINSLTHRFEKSDKWAVIVILLEVE